MELIYICYADRDGRLIDLNVSDEFWVQTIDKEILIERDSIRTVPNFFGERVSNVSAYVGPNGVGKTTGICQALMKHRSYDYRVIIYRVEEQLILYLQPDSKYNIVNNSGLNTNNQNIEELDDRIPLQEGSQSITYRIDFSKVGLIPIYYSSSLSDAHLNISSFRSDISTVGMIGREWEENEDSILNFRDSEMVRQLGFLNSEIGKKFESELFEMNPKILVAHQTNNILPGVKELLEIPVFKRIYQELGKKGGVTIVDEWPNAPKILIVLWTFMRYQPSMLTDDIFRYLKDLDVSFDHDSIQKIEKNSEQLNLNVFIGGLIDFLNKNISEFSGFSVRGNLLEDSYPNLSLSITNWAFYIDKSHYKELSALLNKARSQGKNDFRFNWTISSGEYSMLALYSRLFGEDNLKYDKNHVLLVIDEGDASFHPEWSRQFVYSILKWVPQILINAKSIQIVLTTHSPYILSDLPGKNVFKLTSSINGLHIQRLKEESFASNVHSLLKDSFFLNSTIGRFAKEQINKFVLPLSELVTELDSESPDENRVDILRSRLMEFGGYEFVGMIGDEVVRNKLQLMFARGMQMDHSSAMIEYYEKRIEELKKVSND